MLFASPDCVNCLGRQGRGPQRFSLNARQPIRTNLYPGIKFCLCSLIWCPVGLRQGGGGLASLYSHPSLYPQNEQGTLWAMPFNPISHGRNYFRTVPKLNPKQRTSLYDLFIYFFLHEQKVNIRATPWQTFKGNSSDTDVNQCSLCEHITWQKLAFCNPLKPSRPHEEGKKMSFKQKDEVKIKRESTALYSLS